jgi:hypothetical protein
MSWWRGFTSEDRLRDRGDAPGAGKQALELAVGAMLGGDEAHRAVGEPVRDPHVGDRVAERRLGEGEEGRHRGVGFWLRLVLGIEARNLREVRRALRHRLERLTFEGRRRRHPEAVDGIGQQQHLDAAGAEAFEIRRGFEPSNVVPGEVIAVWFSLTAPT